MKYIKIGDLIIGGLFIAWLVVLGFIAYKSMVGDMCATSKPSPTYNGPVVHVQPIPPAHTPSPTLLGTDTRGSVTIRVAT